MEKRQLNKKSFPILPWISKWLSTKEEFRVITKGIYPYGKFSRLREEMEGQKLERKRKKERLAWPRRKRYLHQLLQDSRELG